MPFATQSVLLGGSVRVGLKIRSISKRGRLAASNAQQVVKVRRIVEELGQQVATPDEVRSWLGSKGPQSVGF